MPQTSPFVVVTCRGPGGEQVNEQRKENIMANEIKNTPIDTIRGRGGVKLTIWKNSSTNGTFYSVEPSRTYKTNDGFGDSRSFSDSELLVLAHLLPKAYDRISALRRQDASEQSASDSEAVSA